MPLDLDRVERLLNIVTSSIKWPQLKPVHDAAMKELNKHSNDVAKELADQAAAELKAKQEKEAEIAAKTKAEAEEDAKPVRRPQPEPQMVKVPSPADDPDPPRLRAGERPDGMPEPTPAGLPRP
jgi:hypothetical protein